MIQSLRQKKWRKTNKGRMCVFILCFVGLFSLAAYIIQLRTKEISVRKILGASLPQIFILLSKNFIQLVVLALILSIPVTYYAIQYWLEHKSLDTLLIGLTSGSIITDQSNRTDLNAIPNCNFLS